MIQIEKFIKISDEKYDIYAAYHTENRWFGNDKMVLYPDFGHEGLPKSELIIMEFFRD